MGKRFMHDSMIRTMKARYFGPRYPHNPSSADFARCIDYSTPPHYEYTNFVIGDVRSTITKYTQMDRMWPLYRVFPLHNMIELLTTVSIRDHEIPGQWDFVLSATEEHLGEEVMSEIDIEHLFIFMESLVLSLDEDMQNSVPFYYQTSDYVFCRWIDPVSLCMQRQNINPLRDSNFRSRWAI